MSPSPDDTSRGRDARATPETGSTGATDVEVRIGGVRDGAHLDGLVATLRTVPGVDGVTLRALGSVHRPVVVLRTSRPVAIASELRASPNVRMRHRVLRKLSRTIRQMPRSRPLYQAETSAWYVYVWLGMS